MQLCEHGPGDARVDLTRLQTNKSLQKTDRLALIGDSLLQTALLCLPHRHDFSWHHVSPAGRAVSAGYALPGKFALWDVDAPLCSARTPGPTTPRQRRPCKYSSQHGRPSSSCRTQYSTGGSMNVPGALGRAAPGRMITVVAGSPTPFWRCRTRAGGARPAHTQTAE